MPYDPARPSLFLSSHSIWVSKDAQSRLAALARAQLAEEGLPFICIQSTSGLQISEVIYKFGSLLESSGLAEAKSSQKLVEQLN